MSDGGGGRTLLGVEMWKPSGKSNVRRSAVRSIAWLGVWVNRSCRTWLSENPRNVRLELQLNNCLARKWLRQQADPRGETNLKIGAERLELATKRFALFIDLSPRVRTRLDRPDKMKPTGILLKIRGDFPCRVDFGWFALVYAELIEDVSNGRRECTL